MVSIDLANHQAFLLGGFLLWLWLGLRFEENSRNLPGADGGRSKAGGFGVCRVGYCRGDAEASCLSQNTARTRGQLPHSNYANRTFLDEEIQEGWLVFLTLLCGSGDLAVQRCGGLCRFSGYALLDSHRCRGRVRRRIMLAVIGLDPVVPPLKSRKNR